MSLLILENSKSGLPTGRQVAEKAESLKI